MATCTIQWITPEGTPTPDTNPAIGTVYRKAYRMFFNGRELSFAESAHYPICLAHAQRLQDSNMEQWVFEPTLATP